jgi:hypothetical protein
MTKNGIEAASELTGDAYAWAEKRMHSVDQNVADAAKRASAVYKRTRGTIFEPFGQERVDLAHKLKDDPPYGIAGVVRAGSLIFAAGLAVYGAIRDAKRDVEKK